jgi:uncharacterized protein with HEPN domain
MKNKEHIAITKMIEYIDKAIKYTEDYNFETFSEDEKTVDATIFALSQIGELVKNIAQETITAYPDIEWRMISGLRNRIVHDYEGINLTLIWYIIEHDIVQLKNELNKILSAEAKKGYK